VAKQMETKMTRIRLSIVARNAEVLDENRLLEVVHDQTDDAPKGFALPLEKAHRQTMTHDPLSGADCSGIVGCLPRRSAMRCY
jgi:hypothetical protein